jgi:IS5 family transposase
MHRSSGQLGFVDQMIGPGHSRSDRFFQAVDQMLDWEPFEERLAVVYNSPKGRPSHPPLMLFKVMLLQRWYSLSDPAAEDALNDRKSFARFVGLGLEQTAPDHSVICRFRKELVRRGLMQPLLDELARQIDDKGLVLKEGTLLDATFVASAARPPAPPRPGKPKKAGPATDQAPAGQAAVAEPQPAAKTDPQAGKRSKIDPEARWARKGKLAVFGYKLHIAADSERRVVRAHRLTAANRNDCELGPDLVQRDGGAHYADKGYSSQPMRDTLHRLGLPDGVMRLGNKHHPDSPAVRCRNRWIAGIRCRVEGVFAEIKRSFGLRRSRYLGMPKVQLDCDLAVFAFNLKTLALSPRPQDRSTR